MDKLMSPDSLWKKKDMLAGKIVTLELDSINTIGNGTTGMIKGNNYHCVYVGFNVDKLKNEWNDIKTYLKNKSIRFKKNDTLTLGFYGVNIINEGDDSIQMPDWVFFKQPYTQFGRDSVIYPALESPHKFITGVVLETRSDYNENNEQFDALIEDRELTIFPIGIKYFCPKKDK